MSRKSREVTQGKGEVLDSWKEISTYLSRSVMTCHRWEQQLGLPVHRLDGTPKARVFAYTSEIDRWKADMLESSESRRPARRKRLKMATLAAGAIVVLTGLALWGRTFFRPAPLPVPVRVPSLAVLPFDNQTDDGSLDAWKTALPDLIMTDLGQSRFLDVVSTTRLYQVLKESAEAEKFPPEELKKVAEKARLDYTLNGTMKASAEGIVITVLIQNPKAGEVTGSLRAICRKEEDFFRAADELSKETKAALNLTRRQIRSDVDEPAARIITNSPEAFKLYSEGYRLQGKGKVIEAMAPLQRAVVLDAGFASAYRLLYHLCLNLSREDESGIYLKKAVDLAGRLPEKERNICLGDYYMNDVKDKKKALLAYQRRQELYPYDITSGGLAELYMGLEEWARAIPVWETLLLRHPKNRGAILGLSKCYRALGRYDRAEMLLDELLSGTPGVQPFLLNARAKLALDQGQFAVAHEYADRLLSLGPDNPSYFLAKGEVYFHQDDLAGAERVFRKLVDSEDKKDQIRAYKGLAQVSLSRGQVERAGSQVGAALEIARDIKDTFQERHLHYLLAYLYRLSGRLPKALKEAEEACRDSGDEGLGAVRELHLRTLITLEMGRFEDFDRQLSEMKAFLDPDRFPMGSPRLMRVYYHLLGHRELRKENSSRAIELFSKATDLFSPSSAADLDADHVKYFGSLAEAYRRSGNLQ